MDHIRQYADDDDEDDGDEERRAVAVSEADGGDRAVRQRRTAAATATEDQEQTKQRRRRRRRGPAQLPDPRALLDGSRARPAAVAPVVLPLPPPTAPPPTPAALIGPQPHDGNFPFLVYVPLPKRGRLPQRLTELAAEAATTVPGLEGLGLPSAAAAAAAGTAATAPSPPPGVPLHISLTRAGTVRLRQVPALVAALGKHLSKALQGAGGGESSALLGRPRAFLNDDRSRAFFVLTVLDPVDPRACSPLLLRAVAACDAALASPGLRLPPYYTDGQPHVSVASCGAEQHAALERAAAGMMMVVDGEAGGRPTLALPPLRCVVCQVGVRRHVVWGEAEEEEEGEEGEGEAAAAQPP